MQKPQRLLATCKHRGTRRDFSPVRGAEERCYVVASVGCAIAMPEGILEVHRFGWDALRRRCTLTRGGVRIAILEINSRGTVAV